MKRFLLRLGVLLLATALPAAADVVPNGPDSTRPNLILDSIATYADGGNFSDAARSECGVDISLPQAVEKFAAEYGTPITLGKLDAPEAAGKLTARIQIEQLVGGAFSKSRWVISELGVSVAVKQDNAEKMSTRFKCNAGPGFAFMYATACSRLERCVQQIGNSAAKWLGLAVRQFGKTTSVPPKATETSLAVVPEK